MIRFFALLFFLVWPSSHNLTLLSANGARQNSAQRAAQARVVRFVPGTSIESLLKPNDRVLVIESEIPPPLIVNPDASTPMAEWLTSQSEFVALIRVYDKVSARTLTGDWVMSTVAAEIKELLKGPSSTELRTGGRVLFSEPGGTVTVAGIEVRARVPYLRPVEIGSEYLVFGGIADTGEVIINGLDVFEIVGNSLRAQSVGQSPAKNRFKDTPLDEVLNQIRRKVSQKPKAPPVRSLSL